MKKYVKKNRQAATRKELDRAFRQLPLAPFFGSLLFSLTPALAPLPPMFHRTARNLDIHLLHGPRNFFGHMGNPRAAHDLFKFRGYAVGLGDRVAQSHRAADDLKVGATRTAIVLALGRISPALRTEHFAESSLADVIG